MENSSVDNTTKDVKTFFDGYATSFDSIYGHTSKRSLIDKLMDKLFRQVMMKRFEEVLVNTKSEQIQTILDIGCGPGHYCVEFLKQGKEVLGIDISANMLEIARQHTSTINDDATKVEFVSGDYTELTLSKKYDAACLMGFFDYIKTPIDILTKLKEDVNKEIYMSFPQAGGILAWQRKIRYSIKNCPLYYYSQNDVKDLLKRAGLDNFEIKDLKRDYFVKVILI